MNIEQVKAILANPENFPISEIFNLLTIASERYYNAVDETEILMTDAEFDSLERFARVQDPTNAYFVGVGSTVRTGKTNLPYPMGGLDQSFEGDTVKFVDSNGLRDKAFTIAQKMDGTSAMIIYDAEGNLQIGFSRGDSQSGADIFRHLSKMKNLPQKINCKTPLVIRAEVEVKEEWFKANQHILLKSDGTPYANARNYVAGKMNASESPQIFYDNVDIIAYTIISPEMEYKDYELKFLKSLGFTVPEYFVLDGREMNDDILSKILKDWHETSPWALDGVVYTVNDRNVQREMIENKNESSSFKPCFARKFKINQYGSITTVRDIEWNLSKHGQLKPVLVFDPILLSGATCTRATAFNAEFVYKNKLGPGATIVVVRSGEVIPFVTKIITPMPEQNMG
jgi:NAD-dependent DNA ligase